MVTPAEEKHLSVSVAGEVSSWLEGSRQSGFFDLKGSVEAVLKETGIDNAIFKGSENESYYNYLR